MAHFTRRAFLKTGLAAGTLAVSGPTAARRPTRERDRRRHARSLGREGHAAGVRHGQLQRARPARPRAGRLHAARAPCLRQRHPLLRDGRVLRRDAPHARRRAEGPPARHVPDHVEGDDPRRCRPAQKFDELRRLANTEYFDIMLLHWQHTATWPTDTRALAGRDPRRPVAEGRARPRRVGARAAGPAARRRATTWLDVAMIRVNHTGKSMDAEDYATSGLGNVPEVVSHVHAVRTRNMGVIAMKLAGEGAFGREDRRQGDALRVPRRGRRLRHGRLQEPRGDRRSPREPEPRAGLVHPRVAFERVDRALHHAVERLTIRGPQAVGHFHDPRGRQVGHLQATPCGRRGST